LSLDPFEIAPIGNPEPDRPFNRLNHAKVDGAGRIWAGTKNDRDEQDSGALYRLGTNLTWTRLDDGYGVTNGPTFSPDALSSTIPTAPGGSSTYHAAFGIANMAASRGRRAWLRPPPASD
jgi:D-xylonolactonase